MKNYSVGALIILIISIGSAAIAYGGGFVIFDLVNLPAWIFGPWGVFTLVFAFVRKAPFYYLGWSALLLAIAFGSIFYKQVNIFVVIGTLLIALAVIASLSLLRTKSKNK